MSASLIFVRDGRTLPFVPVTAAALAAIDAEVPARRKAYARSLYLALLELANEARTERVAVTRKALGERSGCSRELVSDLRPALEAAGVVTVHERTHGGQMLEHEWVVVEPEDAADGGPPEERTPVPDRHDPRAHEARLSLEGEKEPTETKTRAKTSVDAREQPPEDFPTELRPHAREVFRVLRAVAEQHGARRVWPLAVGRVVMAHPRHPLVATAHALAAWAVDPPRPIRDVVATYRQFLSRERELASAEHLADDGTASAAPAGSPPGVTPLRGREARKAGSEWATRRFMALANGATEEEARRFASTGATS